MKFKKGDKVQLINYPQAVGIVTGCSKFYVFVKTSGTDNKGTHPFGTFDQVQHYGSKD